MRRKLKRNSGLLYLTEDQRNFHTGACSTFRQTIWEAAVKAFNVHIKKILGEARLNFEGFITVLVQMEACLNSRPLIPIPDASAAMD